MEPLDELAGRLDHAAAGLTDAARALAGPVPDPAAFGADAPGRFAELGRALHSSWVTATAARVGEAATTADRLTDLAHAVRVAARGYADTDEQAVRRQAGPR